jgi:hypothetical protein
MINWLRKIFSKSTTITINVNISGTIEHIGKTIESNAQSITQPQSYFDIKTQNSKQVQAQQTQEQITLDIKDAINNAPEIKANFGKDG